jgi:hypothetical protein
MLKWIGHRKGMAGLPNVPGRDLSDEEIEARGLDRKALLKSGLYEEEKPAKKELKVKTEDKGMED